MSILENFLTYVKIDTQSDENVSVNPTTKKQFDLGNLLVKQLHELGVKNAFIDDTCYVYGFIPCNTESTKTIGLIAHMDTATELTGKNVKPQVIEDYDGKDIVLNKELNIILSPTEFPFLSKKLHHTLVTTDGTTLLGADDKAGVAIIMEVVKTLTTTTSPHPNVIITFTPDEEVGMGTNSFNFDYYQKRNCQMAYTLDGGDINTLSFENFNAASATITLKGKAIHPGSAKGKMVNSIHLAMEFHEMLPAYMVPATTENYEGFNHLNNIEGSVEETKLHYIIRNHDMNKFRKQIDLFNSITEFMNKKYGQGTVNADIKDSYYNMKEVVLKHPEIIEYAIKGLKRNNIEPFIEPIRGGTDGARLSFKGILTPNLGTGGENYHGKYEYVSVTDMEKMVKVVLDILKIITE